MNLNLSNEVTDFVKGLISQGRFDSEEAAVAEGLRLLVEREKLRAEIQIGIEQVERGEWYDEDTVFAKVNAKIDEIESRQLGN